MDICSVCGCSKNDTSRFYKKTIYGDNLCNKHYIQLNRHGKILEYEKRTKAEGKMCVVCGDTHSIKHCHIPDINKDYLDVALCQYHYGQVTKYNHINDTNKAPSRQSRVCCICRKGASDSKIIYYKEDCRMYCQRHYSQIKNLGGVKERTRVDINRFEKIVVDGVEVISVILEGKGLKEVARILVDIDDYERYFKNQRLSTNRKYAKLGRKQIQKIIMNTDKLVDHINLNSLDNRKCNLRVANKSKNAINCDIRVSNKSGFTGVSFDKKTQNWRVYISYDNKRVELGHYDSLKEAVEMRIKNEFLHFKEFRHNHNEDNYKVRYGSNAWMSFTETLRKEGVSCE